MYVYVLIWAIPALFALSPVRVSPALRALLLIAVAGALTMIIGLRFEVGADWFNYVSIHDGIVAAPTPLWIALSEPAYALLNRLAPDPVGGIVIVNLVCATIYVTGLVLLCRDQPLPALALAVAIPYLSIVVAMGYTRQSAALGFVFLGLVALRRGWVWTYLALIVAATLFHTSAIVAAPLMLVRTSPRVRILAVPLFIAVLPIVFILSSTMFSDKFDIYVVRGMSSEGALTRVLMNVVPAIIFLGWRARFQARWPDDVAIGTALAIAAILSVPLLAVASTAADRINLFIAPLQIVVYARLPLLLRGHWRAAAYTGVLTLYGATLALWLTTSFYAACCWIPYRWAL